jgi:SpoIID/LytB domain protein
MAKAGSTETEILTHYYTGTSVETVPVDQDIRVQVFGSGSDNRNSVDVVVRSPGSDATDDGQWRMQFYDAGESSAHTTWYGINNDDLMVTRSGGTVTVKREDGRTESATGVISLHWESTSFYQPTSNEDAYVELLSKEGGSALTHGQYRHGRLLISSINSRINIVNTLDLNTEYLYGIAEMPSSWSAEALQAQAIAARGYAVRNLGLSSACDCDLYDDPRSQNFSGWKKEDEGTNAYYGKRWVAAVNATNSSSGASGKVLTYGSGGVGNIVRTYYFSSSGGQTENSEDIWVSKLSYLRSVSDPWSVSSTVNNPNASWSDSISQARAESLFGLDDIVSIAVATRTGSSSKAAALTLKATSLSGATATITGGDKIRIGLGVKSPWVWTITPS